MKDKRNERRPARSLTVTLAIAFFALSAVVLLINGGLAVYSNYLNLRDTISNRLELSARQAVDAVGVSIQQKFNTLETSAEFINPQYATSSDQQTVLENILDLEPAFRQVAFLNPNGIPLAQISRLSSTLSMQFKNQFRGDALTATQKETRYVSPVYIDASTSEPLAVIAVPVRNVFGDFQGVLVAELNMKFMWDLVDQLKVGNTGYVYVVDNQGGLIAFNDIARVLAGENLKDNFEVREFIKNPSEAHDSVMSYTGLTGKAVVGYHIPLGIPPWAVVVELPTTEAYQPITQFLRTSAVGIFIFAILAGLAGLTLARRLAAPIIDLSAVASHIANGDLQLQATVSGAAEVAKLASTFNTMTSQLRDMISSLERRVNERTKALQTSSEVSRRLSTILDQQQLVSEVVNQVRDAFDYYHVQIYFYDEAHENLVMAGGTGEAGKVMLEQFHKLAKGRGLVGRAAENNKPVLVADTFQDRQWLPNPLLPDTRSEVAIPISVGDTVLGVLDIQHNAPDGLKSEDIDALQSIAHQVAVALQNTRSYTEMQRAQALLAEALDISRIGNWEFDLEKDLFTFNDQFYSIFHTSVEKVGGYKISSSDYAKNFVHPDDAALVGAEIQRALESKERLYSAALEHRIIFDNGEIGYISVKVYLERDEDGKIIRWYGANQDVTERRRLEELNRKRAAEQEAINLITQKIQSTTTIESALQIAARELGHVFGKKPAAVSLHIDAGMVGETKSQPVVENNE